MDDKKQEKKTRQIIIEFDASKINILKAEVASNWELKAILKELLNKL